MLFLRQIQSKAKPVAEEIICDPFLISLPLSTITWLFGGVWLSYALTLFIYTKLVIALLFQIVFIKVWMR